MLSTSSRPKLMATCKEPSGNPIGHLGVWKAGAPGAPLALAGSRDELRDGPTNEERERWRTSVT
jgi:hypothetical protein